MIFIVSKKQGPYGSLVIVTDKDLVGKKFEEGKLQLDLSKAFYLGEECTKEEVKSLLKEAQHIHLTGKKSVALGVEMNLISKKKIICVLGIQHAEMVLA